jgi:beta-xylosidase
MKSTLLVLLTIVWFVPASAQNWIPDLQNGKYKNPIIHADYSDPDVIRAGNFYYMVASSFNCMPGIPVLKSADLVNWEIVNHIYDQLPLEKYDKVVHGQGSWAPSIRFHNGRYYVYFCTPNDGLFMAESDHPEKKWTLHFVTKIELWEDPCPMWDDDGNAYLVRSKVCGNELFLHRMSNDGKTLIDNGVSIFKSETQPTIEGPKFMKKDGFYYIHAPAGGVPTGWQTVLRSKNIYGPYEEKIVLHRGNSEINGPHQGGLVDTPDGKWWFVHFQDKGYHGRIAHLQPVVWNDGWPAMGIDVNNDGIGEPVGEFEMPVLSSTKKITIPQTSDEFNEASFGFQWQWQANPKSHWHNLQQNNGFLRLNAVSNPTQNGNLWFVPNLLLQKFPQPVFTATTKLSFNPDAIGDKAGLVVMGKKWAYISIEKTSSGLQIAQYLGAYQQCNDLTEQKESASSVTGDIYFRVMVNKEGICRFAYSTDGIEYRLLGDGFKAEAGVWIGAKVGIFCLSPNLAPSKGYTDFDWFRIE